MRRYSNCSTWRCATSRKNGPCQSATGKPRSTASPLFTKTGCRWTKLGADYRMNQQGKKPGYGNRGKTNRVFPPFPQPLLLLTNQMKAADQKQETIVYTKHLTLPSAWLGTISSFAPTFPMGNGSGSKLPV